MYYQFPIDLEPKKKFCFVQTKSGIVCNPISANQYSQLICHLINQTVECIDIADNEQIWKQESVLGKFLPKKIPPRKVPPGKFLLWKIPPMENSSYGKFLPWKIPPMENSTSNLPCKFKKKKKICFVFL